MHIKQLSISSLLRLHLKKICHDRIVIIGFTYLPDNLINKIQFDFNLEDNNY
jgi:hypothetical protein